MEKYKPYSEMQKLLEKTLTEYSSQPRAKAVDAVLALFKSKLSASMNIERARTVFDRVLLENSGTSRCVASLRLMEAYATKLALVRQP